MNTQIAYRESWAKLRHMKIPFLSTHPEVHPSGWIKEIEEIFRNEERFPVKTKQPKLRFIVEEIGHLPAKVFGAKYFVQLRGLAYIMAEKGGRNWRERRLRGETYGDIIVICELKLTRCNIDNLPPRRASAQLELFPKKTSN